MANSNDGKPFDPYSAPTIMDAHPVGMGDAQQTYAPPKQEPREPSAPKGIGALLGEAFNLYKSNLALFLVTAAIALGPVYLVKDGLVALLVPGSVATSQLQGTAEKLKAVQEEMQEAQQRGASAEEMQALAQKQMDLAGSALAESGGALARFFAAIVGLLLTIPLIVVGNYLAQAALTVVVADRAREGSLTAGGAWGVVGARLPSLLGASIVAAIGTAVGLFFCIVPGVVFAFLASLAIPAVLLEKKDAIGAVKRSIELVKSDWLRVLVVFIVFAVVTAVARFVGGLFIPDRFFFLDMLVSDLVGIVAAPFPIIGLVLLYQDIQRSRMQLSDKEIDRQAGELFEPAL